MIRVIGLGQHASVCREAARWFQFGAVIARGDNRARRQMAAEVPLDDCGVLIAASAVVSKSASIGPGTVILEGAIVQARSKIGKHCIINAAAVVTHDCIIEDYAHIAPGAHLCGGVHVGEGALVGVGVGIEPGVKIPAWSVVKRIPYVIALADH